MRSVSSVGVDGIMKCGGNFRRAIAWQEQYFTTTNAAPAAIFTLIISTTVSDLVSSPIDARPPLRRPLYHDLATNKLLSKHVGGYGCLVVDAFRGPFSLEPTRSPRALDTGLLTLIEFGLGCGDRGTTREERFCCGNAFHGKYDKTLSFVL